MPGIFGKIKQKLSRAGDQMEKYQEAITFAEAGESELAMETMAAQKEEPARAKPRLRAHPVGDLQRR